MTITNSEIDRTVLFNYLKENNFNVYDYIIEIVKWNDNGESYTVVLHAFMRVGYFDKNDLNWETIEENHNIYFTIGKEKFDEYYKREVRNQGIDKIIDLDN
jgi:hypothetical protein